MIPSQVSKEQHPRLIDLNAGVEETSVSSPAFDSRHAPFRDILVNAENLLGKLVKVVNIT